MAETTNLYTLKIANLLCPVKKGIDLIDIIADTYNLNKDDIRDLTILRRSTDARKKNVRFIYTVTIKICLKTNEKNRVLSCGDIEEYVYRDKQVFDKLSPRTFPPVIIGCGPAGLFAALTLIERGLCPVIFERGERINARIQSVNKFLNDGRLNPESNMFFGEGGAGTFSDGKLTTRIKSELKDRVLNQFVDSGAESDILYLTRPHLGTDNLRKIIPNMVDHLIRKGTVFHFKTRIDDIIIENNKIKGVRADKEFIKTNTVILATGHSSHDTYELLKNKPVLIEPKGFAAGFRIEHPKEFIDRSQYGEFAGNQLLGPAEYYLTYKDKRTQKGVYSFCMCPGGYVVGCSSSNNSLCTNGMSEYKRDSSYSNAAIVVTISPDDIPGNDPLKGIYYIKSLESIAFKLGGGGFSAPVQKTSDYLDSKISSPQIKNVSYRPKFKSADLNGCFESDISNILKRSLYDFNNKIPGFIEEGILFGVETRTSSPLRIIRDPVKFNAAGIEGLFPIGEAAGYAGGIMSSAVDGVKAARAID